MPYRTSFPLSVFLGAFSLFLCIFTLTFPEHRSRLRYLRLLLAFPTCALFYAVAYPPTNVGEKLALIGYTVGAYGFMKTLDVCVIGFRDRDEDVPRWVRLLRDKEKNGKPRVGRVVLGMPTTFAGRLAYAVDYLFAVRGGSFWKDHAWTWATEAICAYDPPRGYGPFLKSRLKTVLVSTLGFDMVSNIIVAQPWNTSAPRPLTGTLPYTHQFFFSLAIGLQVYFSCFLAIDAATIVLVPLLRLHPETWAPFWFDPHKSTSLEEFWSRRWHATFQRVFYRISLPIVEPFRTRVSPSTLRFVRATVIFGISAMYHMAIPLVRLPWDQARYLVFWERSVMTCFLSQPVGLVLETTVIHPATERLPEKWKVEPRRLFFWMWLVWTGRWFCDSYLAYGPFDELVFGPWSPTHIFLQMIGWI